MAKTTSKAQRKLTKKITRISGGEGIDASAFPPTHLQTKQEAKIAKTLLGGGVGSSDLGSVNHNDNHNADASSTSRSKKALDRKRMSAVKSSKAKTSGGNKRSGAHDSNEDDSTSNTNSHDMSEDAIARRVGRHVKGGGGGGGAASSGGIVVKTRVKSRTRELRALRGGASERMARVHDELDLFDRIVNVPEFAADPFAAIQEHLAATMEVLHPLTADVGRVPRP